MLVKLVNRRAIPMVIPDGTGRTIELLPNQEKIVEGDYDHLHKLPAMGVTGLVVKKVAGKQRLVEGAAVKDLKRVLITNHRAIPFGVMALGTGSSISLNPGESKETVARVSVVKQHIGISVKVIGEAKAVPSASAVPPPAPTIAPPPPIQKPAPVKTAQKVTPPSVPPERDLKKELQLPETIGEFAKVSENFSMRDLRGIAFRLGIKGGRSKSALAKAIAAEIYGA